MKPYDKQIGGNHYQKYKIQPSKFVIENKLLYPEGCAIKYIVRHSDKGKKQDLEKAIHRSEEHTSELQSQSTISYAVFCLKKKKYKKQRHNHKNKQ